MDKLAQLMARPGQDPNAKDDVAWWMRYAGRGLGIVGSVFAILFGFWNCFGLITINISSLLSGMWQVVAGFIVMAVEAPCCCMFIDHVQRISEKIDARPYWNRAAAYVILAIPPIILYPSLGSVFGSGLIFATGVIYGMMSLGKKASAEEMRAAAMAAEAGQAPGSAPQGNIQPTSSIHANLVANAQPMAFTGVPVFDSNV